MVKIHSEDIKSDFKGTIIDLETIGDFDKTYRDYDSRHYKTIIPVIFGFINKGEIQILWAENQDSIPELKMNIIEILPSLETPFHAFNSIFERGVLFHGINKKIEFEKELNLYIYEAKKDAVQLLEIDNYDDPFYDNGLRCKEAWLSGKIDEIDKCIKHNRACLLKERDIFFKRKFREPDKLKFIK